MSHAMGPWTPAAGGIPSAPVTYPVRMIIGLPALAADGRAA
ncbi:hypothetical protein [Streptomyces syringium]|uniref:Uncharacterized protein n=1 Tax=Streptomyces syringium TaxID=76729 RepID=A0ABS4Y0E2_9ACTN|nr:hypothetical protein [Streptomyces syringium]MBP2402220.1 hypothetical protein [Streptomyces syringium]